MFFLFLRSEWAVQFLFAKMKQSLLWFGRKIVQLGLIVVLATQFLPLKKKI